MVVEPHTALPPPPRRRRRRRPTLWDVRDPPYGIPFPPPGDPPAASQRSTPTAPKTSAFPSTSPHASSTPPRRSIPLDVVRAPHPGEAGALAGIDVPALRLLLAGPRSTAVSPQGLSSSRAETAIGHAENSTSGNDSGPIAPSASHGAQPAVPKTAGFMTTSGRAPGGNGVIPSFPKAEEDHKISPTSTTRDGRGPPGGIGDTNRSGVGDVGSGVGASGLLTTAGTSGTSLAGSNMQATRHARRLYVGNLPPETTDVQIGDFFNRALVAAHGSESGDEPVVSVYINLDKRFAFIETRTIREAAAGLMLDGVRFRDMFLRVRRPNDFQPNAVGGGSSALRPPEAFDPTVLGIVSTQVSDGPNKMFVGGLPYTLTEDQIKSLLASYGQLAAFNLIKEPNSGMSKGFAFFEYVDGSVVDAACKGLHGMKVGDKTLTVRRATHSSGTTGTFASGTARQNGSTVGLTQTSSLSVQTPGGPIPASVLVRNVTRVICLDEAISPAELDDDREYEDVVEDVREEASKIGIVEEVFVPRYVDGEQLAAVVGKIFVRYANVDDADRAQMIFAGRRFGERAVASSFFDEEQFKRRIFDTLA